MRAVVIIDVDENIKLDRTYIAYDLYDGDNMDVISKVIGYGYAPLKPLPEKKSVKVEKIEDLMHTEFLLDSLVAKINLDTDRLIALGWNSCVDEILGGTK